MMNSAEGQEIDKKMCRSNLPLYCKAQGVHRQSTVKVEARGLWIGCGNSAPVRDSVELRRQCTVLSQWALVNGVTSRRARIAQPWIPIAGAWKNLKRTIRPSSASQNKHSSAKKKWKKQKSNK